MGQDPDAIRDEVEQTRERMGETIDALGHKADVRGRAKESISARVEGAKERRGRAAGMARENPLGLAIGAVAVGFVGGLLVPSSRMEDEKLGPMADQVKDQAKQTGQELAGSAKESAGATNG